MDKALRPFFAFVLLCASAFGQSILAPIFQKAPVAGGVTWTVVQHPSYHLTVAGTSVPLDAAHGGMVSTTAGNTLWFIYFDNSACVVSTNITDTAGDTFTADSTLGAGKFCAYYVLNGTGGATGITATGLPSGGAISALVELHRSTGTAATDGSQQGYNGGASTSWASGAITTTGTSDAAIGIVVDLSSSTPTLTPSGGFSTIQTEVDGFDGFKFLVVDQLNVAAATYNNTGTSGTSDAIAAGVAAFK